MTKLASGVRPALASSRRGAVSIIFATAIIPLAMSVGLAIDYGFYVQALAQSTMAADAAAIHAVRLAVTTYNSSNNATSAGQSGGQSGLQWFNAQLGSLATGAVPASSISVFPPGGASNCSASPCVGFTQSTGTFSTTVSYKLQVPTHFGGLFHMPLWTTSQSASSSVTANSFIELVMLLDTSASMSIGTTSEDMLKTEQLSVCMPTATAANVITAGNESDVFKFSYLTSGMGYAPNNITPTPSSDAGSCDSRFLAIPEADQRLCKSLPTIIPNTVFPYVPQNVNNNGFCPPGYGVPDTSSPPKTDSLNNNHIANLPISTCSLSCHNDTSGNGNDLSGLVAAANKYNNAGISIRLDVVKQAAGNVIQTLIQKEQQLGLPNQFSVGVGEINSTYGQQDYPPAGFPFVEAGTNLQAAYNAVNSIQPTNNSTDIDDLLKTFASLTTPGGTGGSAATPRKNIFLVTDGLQDTLRSGMPAGPRWTALNPANCNVLKQMNFSIFVLYTPYYPVPHDQYLDSITSLSEPLANSPITAALTACATPGQFFRASSQTDINNAMQTMLALALNQPATITQ